LTQLQGIIIIAHMCEFWIKDEVLIFNAPKNSLPTLSPHPSLSSYTPPPSLNPNGSLAEVKGNLYEFYICMCFNSTPLFEKFANIYVKHFVGVCLCVCVCVMGVAAAPHTTHTHTQHTLAIFIDFFTNAHKACGIYILNFSECIR